MEPIYTQENPMPGVKQLKIYEALYDELGAIYPIDVDGTNYHISPNDEGLWRANGLSEDIASEIGHIIATHEL